MPRKPQPKAEDPAQYKRFVKAARDAEANENPKAFDAAFTKITKAKVQRASGSGTKRNPGG